MRLIPCRTVPLACALPPAELLALLRGVIGEAPAAPFAGSVKADAFVVDRIRQFGNANLPILRGRIRPTGGGGTRVTLRLRPPGVVAVFMGIWLGFLAAFAALVVGAHALYPGRSLLPLAAPVTLAALSWLLMVAVFEADARWALDRFLAALPALEPASEGDAADRPGTLTAPQAAAKGPDARRASPEE